MSTNEQNEIINITKRIKSLEKLINELFYKNSLKTAENNIIKTTMFTKSNQSQKHGFINENYIRVHAFNLPIENNNTAIHDIPKDKNKYNLNENCSIKTTGSTTICCGDILRFYNYNLQEKNTIIIIKYKQIENKKITENIYEIDYNEKCHKLLFGNLPKDIIENYITKVKSIPTKTKGKDAKEIFDYLNEKKKIEKDYPHTIQINPKVDGSQSRVQCSIVNFEKTLKDFITCNSFNCYGRPNIFRNVEIIPTIISSKRPRNEITCIELKKLCKDNKIKKYSKLNKQNLIDLLKKNNINIEIK